MMKSRLEDTEQSIVSEQAAQWLTVLAEGDSEERMAFVAWLKKSPRNVEEFLFASATVKTFAAGGVRDSDEVDRIVARALAVNPTANVVPWVKEAAENESRPRPAAKNARTRSRFVSAWPVSLVASFAVLALGWVFREPLALFMTPHTYATGLGEQRTVRLPDGSVVFLNARSRIRIDYSETARNLELIDGEAIFKVERDAARPFSVSTGAAIVQAIGTQFNIYRQSEGTLVSVLEGRVRISPEFVGGKFAAPSIVDSRVDLTNDSLADPTVGATHLAAGEEARIAPTGQVEKRSKPDVAATVAWRQRRLVFRADRLEDIVAQFQRYSPRRIELADEMARDKRITGTFDADDPGSLMLFLQGLNELNVEAEGEGFVVRGQVPHPINAGSVDTD